MYGKASGLLMCLRVIPSGHRQLCLWYHASAGSAWGVEAPPPPLLSRAPQNYNPRPQLGRVGLLCHIHRCGGNGHFEGSWWGDMKIKEKLEWYWPVESLMSTRVVCFLFPWGLGEVQCPSAARGVTSSYPCSHITGIYYYIDSIQVLHPTILII